MKKSVAEVLMQLGYNMKKKEKKIPKNLHSAVEAIDYHINGRLEEEEGRDAEERREELRRLLAAGAEEGGVIQGD